MLKEFRDFAIKGNAIDMAVGIIIGAAFTTIVNSLVSDVLMPPIGLLFGYDFSNLFLVIKSGADAGHYATLAEAKKAGAVTLNYGQFVNNVVNFLIVAFAMFLLIKSVNRVLSTAAAEPPPSPASKDCQYCLSKIPLKATRCPHCTSRLE